MPSRREFFLRAGHAFGGLALATMLDRDGWLASARADVPEIDPLRPLAPRVPHFEAGAKSCIFLFMEGGPSHLALFAPKPELTKRNGQPLPPSFGKVFTPMGVGGNSLLA